MIRSLTVLAILVASGAVAQDTPTARDVQRQLFNESRAELVMHPHPSMSTVEAGAFEQVADQLVSQVPYYGAIAISPDQGLNSTATTARGNYHSFQAASAAVLADCNAARSRGSARCVVVAEVRPRNWQARAFQLSAGATAIFRREYRRGREERAFAISPTSGGYGVGKGPGAAVSAVAACNQAGGVSDCQVAVADN